MEKKADVWQGTLALMVLRTLETIGPLHGYGIARRIEQTSGGQLVGELRDAVSGTSQAGAVGLHLGGMGVSDNNRRAKYYRLTRAGRKQRSRLSAGKR